MVGGYNAVKLRCVVLTSIHFPVTEFRKGKRFAALIDAIRKAGNFVIAAAKREKQIAIWSPEVENRIVNEYPATITRRLIAANNALTATVLCNLHEQRVQNRSSHF